MPVFLLIGIAGAIGTLLRYSISLLFPLEGVAFPMATAIANLLGCFVLAWLASFYSGKRQVSEKFEAVIYTGLIGSFTTFSTFSVETIGLLQQHAYITAFAYVIVSAVGGLLLAMVGFSLGRRPHEERGSSG